MATAVASVHAQAPAGGRPTFAMSEGQLSGQIVDNTGKPIAQASVNLLKVIKDQATGCLLYTSPSPRD